MKRREKDGEKGRSRSFLYILAGFAVLILMDFLIVSSYVQNYNEKITILCVMLEEQEKGTDSLKTATDLLKGAETDRGEEGREILESYGYLKEQKNRYQEELRQDMIKVLLFSLLFYGIYLLLLWEQRRKQKQIYQQQIKEISVVLEQFQKGIYRIEEDFAEKQDFTARQLWEQMESLGEQLSLKEERMEREKEETKSLVTDISHQLKTPVAALKTCFEILRQDDLTPEERAEFSGQCSRQLAGLEALVSALVNISRMEAGMIQLKQEPVDLKETLIQAVNRVYLKAEAKQITIEMEENDESEQTVIPHDVKWTCEAFINLLENAVKYSPAGSHISIRMIRRTTFLRVEIEDEGIGIPKEEYHKVFKRFYRGQAQEVQSAEGSGVGLYLTREIISRQNGSVTVSSKCGGEKKGSVFTVQMPYA